MLDMDPLELIQKATIDNTVAACVAHHLYLINNVDLKLKSKWDITFENNQDSITIIL